jgi:hypothetical protein
MSRGLRIAVAALGATLALGPVAAMAATPVSQTFSTAGEQLFTVPPGVSSVQVALVGGHGGSGSGGAPGGTGATVAAMLAVSPGETLYAEVGGDGQQAELPGEGRGGSDGGGGGGITTFLFGSAPAGGGGGGASDVRTCAAAASPAECGGLQSLASRLVVAGGGGGGGGNGRDPLTTAGGVGGAGDQPGTAGAHDAIGNVGGSGGTRGSATKGGVGGTPSGSCTGASENGCAGDGTLGRGGAGGESLGGGGGGGGGGVYGAGGGGGGEFGEISPTEFANGGGGGGGGGSSGVPAGATGVSDFSYTPSAEGAQPAVTFSWTPAPPAVVTAAASAVTATTTTLNGTVNPDAWQVTSCGFDISPAPAGVASFPCAQQLTAGGTPTAVSATAAGLTPATTYTVTLTATTTQGAGSGSPVTFTTPSAPPPADSGPAVGIGAATALTVTNLRLAPARLRRGRRAAGIVRRKAKAPPAATTIAFALSAAASVRLGFEERRPGVLVARKCAAVSKSHRAGRRCARYVAIAGGVVLAASAGTDRIAFDGVLSGGKLLAAGTYRLSLTATAGSYSTHAAQHPQFMLLA